MCVKHSYECVSSLRHHVFHVSQMGCQGIVCTCAYACMCVCICVGICIWDMQEKCHIWISWVILVHMYTYICVYIHMHIYIYQYVILLSTCNTWTPCRTHEWVLSHMCMSHIAHKVPVYSRPFELTRTPSWMNSFCPTAQVHVWEEQEWKVYWDASWNNTSQTHSSPFSFGLLREQPCTESSLLHWEPVYCQRSS